MEEEFRKIKGNEDYEISNFGNLVSLKYNKRKYRKATLQKTGYLRVSLWKNGKNKSEFIHRLVAVTYIKNPKNKREVNHKDGIKIHNEEENLEWATRLENVRHAVDNDLQSKGIDIPTSKLKENDVVLIREKYPKGKRTMKEIGEEYGVSESTISRVLLKKTWKHI